MKVANLIADTRDCYVVVSHICTAACKAAQHAPARVTVTYAPTGISTDTLRSAAKIDRLEGLPKLDLLIQLCKRLVRAWDIELDPPQQGEDESDAAYALALADWESTGPHYVPLTDAELAKLPVMFLAASIKAVVMDVQVNPLNGTDSETTSPALSVKKRRA